MNKIAVVRVRGNVKLDQDILTTFDTLNLRNKNWCVFLDENDTNMGTVKKVKDYVTWGSVSDELIAKIIENRGETYNGNVTDSKGKIDYRRRFVEHNGVKYKKFFRLMPPNKGYGRKGIKKPFSVGGALGDRKDKMSELLNNMI